MSNLVFPSAFPGLGIKIRSELFEKVATQETQSGRELRSVWALYMRRKYTVEFDAIRGYGSLAEFQEYFTFIARHFGQLDSFLLTDPDDSSVTDCGFGVGDGTTVGFQLQRAMTGNERDKLGLWPNGTKPRTNLCPYSADLTQWSTVVTGTGVAPVRIAAAGVAPDGTPTATRIRVDRGTGTTISDRCGVFRAGVTMTPGATYVSSIWLKTADGSTQQVLFGTVSGVYNLLTVTGTWQRFTAPVYTSDGSLQNVNLIDSRGSTAMTAQVADLLAWGGQCEQGSVPTQYIPTTSAAVTSNPLYWPSLGDGYEPVFDLNGPISVYLDGDWQGRRQLYQTARTNLAVQSQFAASWSASNVTLTLAAGTAPDGTNTAAKLVENTTATVDHYTGPSTYPTLAAYTRYVRSVYAKASGRNLQIEFRTLDGTWCTGTFDLTAGTVVGYSGATAAGAGIQAVGSGWYRCWLACDSSTGAIANNCAFHLYNGTITYTGDGASGIFLWGAQTEAVAPGTTTPTGYIPTVAAAVTVTDFSLSSLGLATLATAPVAGAFLSWTGSYFRRVRFLDQAIGADRIAAQMYEGRGINLVSVKP